MRLAAGGGCNMRSKPRLIIGLSGKAKTGKDYICKHLIEHFSSAKRYAFADHLKDIYAEKHGITLLDLEQNKEIHRQGLIDLAEKDLKADDQAYFGKRFCRELDYGQIDATIIIITDIRYHAELFFTLGYLEAKHIPQILIGVQRDEVEDVRCGWCLDDVTVDHVFHNSQDEAKFKSEMQSLIDLVYNVLSPTQKSL